MLLSIGWLILIGVLVFIVLSFGSQIWDLLRDEEKLERFVNSYGLIGPLVFIGLQVLQVVIFIIPGEVVQIAGGYIYGPWLGLIYSLAGLTLGSVIAFFIGRLLGRPFIELMIHRGTVDKFDRSINRRGGLAALFVLFLLPGVPKDALCYITGLSAIRFLLFFLISLIGRVPGVILSTAFGSKLAAGEYKLVAAIAVITIAFFISTFIFKERVARFRNKILEKLGRKGNGEEE